MKRKIIVTAALVILIPTVLWVISRAQQAFQPVPPLNGEWSLVFVTPAQKSLQTADATGKSIISRETIYTSTDPIYYPVLSHDGEKIAFKTVSHEGDYFSSSWWGPLDGPFSIINSGNRTNVFRDQLRWSKDDKLIDIDRGRGSMVFRVTSGTLEGSEGESQNLFDDFPLCRDCGSTKIVSPSKNRWVIATYQECSFFVAFCSGRNALRIKWKYSPFSHKIGDGSFNNLYWLSNHHFLVEHDGNIELWDVRGKVYWSIPGRMYDIWPKPAS